MTQRRKLAALSGFTDAALRAAQGRMAVIDRRLQGIGAGLRELESMAAPASAAQAQLGGWSEATWQKWRARRRQELLTEREKVMSEREEALAELRQRFGKDHALAGILKRLDGRCR